MRVLTAISGIILAAAGAFCFGFYKAGFIGCAFVLGIALLLVGICLIISYWLSFRKASLPDTVLVEGMYDLAVSVAVLANMVSDNNVMLLFGTWLLISGVTRFSQSLAVSRINPRGWFVVLPLGIINALAGLVMLMPSVLSGVNTMQMIGVACLLNGFSLLVYAAYMVRKEENPKAEAAKQRAEAKKAIAEEKRRKRDELRSLSEAEREVVLEQARSEKKKAYEQKKQQRLAQKEADRSKRRPATDRTVELSAEESKEIKLAAKAVNTEALEAAEDAAKKKPAKAKTSKVKTDDKAAKEAAEKAALIAAITEDKPSFSQTEQFAAIPKGVVKDFSEKSKDYKFIEDTEMPDEPAKEEAPAETEAPAEISVQEPAPEEKEEPVSARPVWVKPTNIPTIEKAARIEDDEDKAEEIRRLSAKRDIVNLDELENRKPELDLPKVELPELKLRSTGGESMNRQAYLLELDKERPEAKIKEEDINNFQPLTLEDLFADESFHIKPLTDKRATETDLKLTQTFTFDWLNTKKQ